MNLAKRNTGGLAVYNAQGLGGFWGFVGKWANKAVGALGKLVGGLARKWLPFGNEIGGYIEKQSLTLGSQLESWINGGSGSGGLNGIEDGNVTAAEEAILNNWLTYFSPYIEQLIIDISNALNLPTTNSKILALNAVLNKVNALNAYYLVDDVNGLSELARQQRSYVVFTSLDPIVKSVQLAVATIGVEADIVPIEFNINLYDFTPLFTTSIVATVKSDNYRLRGLIKPISTLPVGSIDFTGNVKLPIKNPIKTAAPTPVVTPTTTPVATTTAPAPVKTGNTPVFTFPAPTQVTTTPVVQTPVTTPVTTVPVATTPVNTPVNNTTKESTETTENNTPEKKSNRGLIIGGLLLLGAAVIASRKQKEAKKRAVKQTKKSK